jgi:hypothetical protein
LATLAACLLAVVAGNIDPPIITATSSGVQNLSHRTHRRGCGRQHLLPDLRGSHGRCRRAGRPFRPAPDADHWPCRMVPFSIATALASDLPSLIVARAGVDIFTAIVLPLSLANVMITFNQRASCLSPLACTCRFSWWPCWDRRPCR